MCKVRTFKVRTSSLKLIFTWLQSYNRLPDQDVKCFQFLHVAAQGDLLNTPGVTAILTSDTISFACS